MKKRVRELGERAEIYLSSNGHRERTKRLSEELGVLFFDTPHQKPSIRAVEGLERKGKPLFVIGDKIVTDGLLALALGATFVPVVPLRGANESTKVRTIYSFDALFLPLLLLFPIVPYLELMRPKQWIKNLLVFAPIFFAGGFLDPTAFVASLLAFTLFSVAASLVYVVNDIADCDADRLHKDKCARPLASRRATHRGAYALVALLLFATLFLLSTFPGLTIPIALYVILNLLYSFSLKHVAVLDIVLVASFYVLRVVVGGMAASVALSPWIVVATFFLALFLVVGKRRAEFAQASRRKVLNGYAQETLDHLLLGSAVLAIAAYGLWSVLVHPYDPVVLTIIPVSAVIFRMLNELYRYPEQGETPETMVFKDRWTLVLTALWVAFMGFVFYI
jgi:4-hydroxybenzoate polyprenyltransferase